MVGPFFTLHKYITTLKFTETSTNHLHKQLYTRHLQLL